MTNTPPQDPGVERARLVRTWRARLGATQDDVADAIGVSRSWYARFERGLPAHFSDEFLHKVADHLQLGDHERVLLGLLTRNLAEPPVAGPPPAAPEDLVRVVQGLPWPAYLCDHAWDIVAANERFAAWCSCRVQDRPNVMRMLFGAADMRRMLSGWEAEWAPRVVEELRLGYARHPQDPRVVAVVREALAVDAHARELWENPAPLIRPYFDAGTYLIFSADQATARRVAVTVQAPLRTDDLRLVILAHVADPGQPSGP